jgi:teichuronic acid biosynthesis glycosyltransferase TuaH
MKDKLSKLNNVFKKYGFIGGIKKCFSYAKSLKNPMNSKNFDANKKFYNDELDLILASNYERIIIWRSTFGWNVPLYQRPQHIFNNLANQNCLVFYEVTTMTDNVDTISKVKDNLYLVNFKNIRYANLLMDKLSSMDIPKYLEFFSTDWMLSLTDLKNYEQNGFKIIYEYIDEISPSVTGTKEIPKNVIDKYNYAMENKNVYVIVSADTLEKDVIKKRGKKNLAYSSNGVDYNHFLEYDEDYNFETKFLESIRKPTICYYGALASWFDYDLIKKISKLNKYNIILFGAKYDESFDKSGINNLKNVYYMGVKDYKVLKNYAHKVDILMIPFLINDVTKSTSPVKLYEYMALHKPIVTTNMPECRKYESVLIGHSQSEFIKKLDEAYKLRKSKKYYKILDKEAQENDWSIKAEAIINLIKKDEK